MTEDNRKPYHQMDEAERRADRISRNRQMEQNAALGAYGLSLETIVDQLDARKQRATYGAVAELVGTIAQAVIQRRPRCPRYSWVVAATTAHGARRGWPTGYTRNQMHRDCYTQASLGDNGLIESAGELRRWLNFGGEPGQLGVRHEV
jgi:hypothetical protein